MTTKAAWKMTDMFHLKAIEIISKSLRGAVENTKEGREGMALGQYIAGMGFSNVGLGIAHSMVHTLGAVYDTPHGVACAMMLPIVMEYNQECTGEKYREIARVMGVPDVDSMDQETYRQAAIDVIQKLADDVGIPKSLSEAGVKREDIPFLAESAFNDACTPGNPRDASKEEIIAQGLVSKEDYELMEKYTYALFARGTEMAAEKGLILVDTKYEFGKKDGKVYLIDEIHTPDSSRYFYADGYQEKFEKGEPQKQLSKEFVRQWLIDHNFMGKEGQQVPEMTDEYVNSVSDRYIELYEHIVGQKFNKADNHDDLAARIEKNVTEYLNQK